MNTRRSSRRKVNVGRTERILSVGGGTALLAWSLLRPTKGKIASALAGGFLVYRGATGRDPVYRMLSIDRVGEAGIEVIHTVTINRPRPEVYAYWRSFANLPHFMLHLEEVRVLDAGRSHWVARAPLGQTVSWDAELTEDRPDERIAWRSLPDSQIKTRGVVRFHDAPAGQGTEVRVHLTYEPPLGSAGAEMARLLGEEPHNQIRDDLRRFKQLLETGQIPSTLGQTSGRLDEVMAERYGVKQQGIVEELLP